jgi:thioesterase domain-containing protein
VEPTAGSHEPGNCGEQHSWQLWKYSKGAIEIEKFLITYRKERRTPHSATSSPTARARPFSLRKLGYAHSRWAVPQIGKWRNQTQTRPIVPLERRKTELPLEKVLEMMAQGLGARRIAKRLTKKGSKVSFMAPDRAPEKQN